MTPLLSSSTFAIASLGIACLGTIILSAYAFVGAMMRQKNHADIVAAAFLFVGSTLLAWLIRLVSLRISPGIYSTGFFKEKLYASAPVTLLASLPAVCVWASVVVLGVASSVLVRRQHIERMNHITPDSIKDALDSLPDAVCFSVADGTPILANAQMDALAHDAFGIALTSDKEIWRCLWEGNCRQGYEAKVLGSQNGYVLMTASDGRAWQFVRRVLPTGKGEVIETIAADVTEEHALVRQLEVQNRRAEEVNERLRAYGRNLTKITREQETLAAKIRVHDEVGRALVALRAYERQRAEDRDREELLRLWWQVTHLLEAAEDEDKPTDDWQLLQDAASAIDVQLELEGELPTGKTDRELAIMVIHECLNNAVRHGGAHLVCVSVGTDCDRTTLTVTNDGTPPSARIEETGGLANIRAAVERAGGTLEVYWSPRVVVEVTLGAGE